MEILLANRILRYVLDSIAGYGKIVLSSTEWDMRWDVVEMIVVVMMLIYFSLRLIKFHSSESNGDFFNKKIFFRRK